MKYLLIFFISISLTKICYAKNVKENTKNYYLNGSIVVWNDRFIDRPNGQVEKWTFFEDKTYKITIHKNNKINKFWQKNYFSTIKEAVQNLPYLIDDENSFLKESGTYKLGGFPKKWLKLSQRPGLQYQIDDDELMEAVYDRLSSQLSLNKTYTFKYYPNSEIENYRIVKKRKQEEKQAKLEKQKLEAKKKKLEEEERKRRELAQQKKLEEDLRIRKEKQDEEKAKLVDKNLKVLKSLKRHNAKHQKAFSDGMCIGFLDIKVKFESPKNYELKWIDKNISTINNFVKIGKKINKKLGNGYTMMSEDLYIKMVENKFSSYEIDLYVGAQIGYLSYKFLNALERQKFSSTC